MTETDNSLVMKSCTDKVLTLTLNRAPAHALSSQMIDALQSALDDAVADPGVNVIVLASSGRVFCAGHDLKEMRAQRDRPDRGRAYFEDVLARCGKMMQSLTMSPKPTIAMVDGIATAAGCQLVAACDMAFASENAGFCTPGVNMGGFCTTPLVAISRNLSRKHAMELALSGDVLDAQAALDFGLVNRVLPDEELERYVTAFATRLASRSPVNIARGKRAMYDQLEMPLAEAYAFATASMVENFMTDDSNEGMEAFLERRPPVWRGA